jgi:serine/threonine-protein kinase
VLGRYALFGEIAAGGMATVHFGMLSGPVGFSRTVAIKRLHPQYAKDPEFVTMFLDEARLAARIRHPNVVPTLDVVATEGELFIVMDYVQGETLARLTRATQAHGGRMPPDICVAVLAGALHGLHAAHEAKDEHGRPLDIVHRDVSPQNILVGIDGMAHVLDFGVAKAAGRLQQQTRDGAVKGKLRYMAPEQILGGKVTRQGDVYAASVVLWECLTGERLLAGDSDAVVLFQALDAKHVPPSDLVPGLPREFDELLAKGLARDAAARFATAREMAIALERCGRMASPREVGVWVEGLASEMLLERAAKVAEIESISSLNNAPSEAAHLLASVLESQADRANPTPSESSLSLDVRIASASPAPIRAAEQAEADAQLSSISVVRSRDSLPYERRAPLLIGAAAAGAVALAVLVFVLFVRRSDVVSASRAEPLVEPARSVVVPTPLAPASAPPLAASSAPAVASSASAPPIALEPSARPRPAPPFTVRPVAKPAPLPSRSCEPPYTLDAQGHRKYKEECLQQ